MNKTIIHCDMGAFYATTYVPDNTACDLYPTEGYPTKGFDLDFIGGLFL